MSKGTPSMGKFKTPTHTRCRRCGNRAFHKAKRRCASCGFGESVKVRKYNWAKRTHKP